MVAASYDLQRADHIYRAGPETLVARSIAIYSGPMSRYARQILEMSQPGPDGFPLKWVVSAQIDEPTPLKGEPPAGPLVITRPEQSMMLPRPPSALDWESHFGDLGPEDRAVVFLQGDPAKPDVKVLPSGTGDRDLISLVRDIARVQSVDEPARRVDAWLSYLEKASLDHGRMAALRSLLQAPVAWSQLAPVLQRVFADSTLSSTMRAFAFGIVAFGVQEEQWGGHELDAVDLLCRWFETGSDSRLTLQNILALKLLLRYASQEPAKRQLHGVAERIFASLKRRAAAMPLSTELLQQYQQIRETYPGKL